MLNKIISYLAQQLDISADEAQDMIDKYNETFFEMYNWKIKEIDSIITANLFPYGFREFA